MAMLNEPRHEGDDYVMGHVPMKMAPYNKGKQRKELKSVVRGLRYVEIEDNDESEVDFFESEDGEE